jgi:hypothetical protein
VGLLGRIMEEVELMDRLDLARLLAEQQRKPMNLVWVAYYWQQVEAYHSIRVHRN